MVKKQQISREGGRILNNSFSYGFVVVDVINIPVISGRSNKINICQIMKYQRS